MKNFIEVNGVEEGSIYAINVNHISKFYPIEKADKNFVEDYFNSKGLSSLMIFADDDMKKRMNDRKEDLMKSNCIIEMVAIDKESNVVCTTDTYEEVKIKIFNATDY